MSLATFIISLLGLVCVIIGGLWRVYTAIAYKIDAINDQNVKKINDLSEKTEQRIEKIYTETSKRIERVYERLDEGKVQYYREFVLKDFHGEAMKHQLELTDQKFLSMMRMFETTMNAMTKEFKDFKEYMIDRFTHK